MAVACVGAGKGTGCTAETLYLAYTLLSTTAAGAGRALGGRESEMMDHLNHQFVKCTGIVQSFGYWAKVCYLLQQSCHAHSRAGSANHHRLPGHTHHSAK